MPATAKPITGAATSVASGPRCVEPVEAEADVERQERQRHRDDDRHRDQAGS